MPFAFVLLRINVSLKKEIELSSTEISGK